MERDEFIKSLGIGLALVCTGTCFQACSKGGNDGPDNPPPGGGNNTASVDLSSRLLNVGDSVTTSGILFIRVATGNQASSFVATEALCPHQGGTLVWKAAENRIQCQTHFSEYNRSGAVLTPPQDGGTTRALRVYTVTVNGSTLTAA